MADRKPLAFINGLPCESVEVTQSRTKDTDSFHATLPLRLGSWDGDQIPVQVQIGADGAPQTVFEGFVDSVEINFSGTLVSLSGRDRGGKLIDTKNRRKFLNKTPGEVVQELAGEAGLGVSMDDIADKAGKIYQIDWNKFLHDVSHWTLINNLADLFGMNAYVTSNTLFFKNLDEDGLSPLNVSYSPPTAESYANGTFIGLTGRRELVVANGANVEVKSWSHKEKKVITSKKGGGDAAFRYASPGLTQGQADRIAAKKLRENSAHGKAVTIDLPGDPSINARSAPTVSGTQTEFDDSYETQSAQHRVSWEEGYRVTVEAKIAGQE